MWRFLKGIWEVMRAEGIVFILFLASTFTHNMDHGSYVFVFLLILLFLRALFQVWKRYFDLTAFLLLFFSITYVLFSPVFDIADAGRLLLGPVLFYMYGRNCVKKVNNNESSIIVMVFLLIVSISLPVWWAVISNMLSGNIISTTSEEGARWLTTWGQSNMTAATIYGIICSFGLCGLGFFVADKGRSKEIGSWALLLCAICSLLSTTYLINRSGIVIIGLVTLIALFYGMRSFSFKSFLLLLLVAAVLVFLFLSLGNIGDILDAYSDRGSISEGGDRTWRWIDAFKRVFTMPFGWSTDNTVKYNYVHNMWLDIARVAGIFPFFAIIIATIRTIRNNVVMFRCGNNRAHLLLITLFSAVFISFMFEPVIEANIFYLAIFSWIWGVEQEVLVQERKQIAK